MELYEELIGKQVGMMVLETIAASDIDYKAIAELESLKALRKIKAIVEDDSLSDFDCVEQIVRVFEDIGSSGGSRHDFG